MKNFSQLNEAQKSKLEIQDNTINYISVADLDKYLEIAGRFISDDAKEVINWLKVNNESYLHELDPSMTADNALAAFYDAGVPKEADKKELYKAIGKVVKANRLLEIPVFQTDEQFNGIINKEISPDEVLLDLTSEKGRSDVFKKYQPLIYKIVNQFLGKSKASYEDLMSAAMEGFTWALNDFGHPKKRGENGHFEKTEKTEAHTTKTFGQFAAFMIRSAVLSETENSHLVHIPKNQQKKERKEQGYNAKNRSISGDTKVGQDSDGNGKTLFDYIDNGENGGKKLDNEDLTKLWQAAYAKLEEKFGKEDMEIFYRCFRLNGYDEEKKKQKDIAAEYGIKPTTLNVRLHKIIEYIKKDKQLYSMFTSILELAHECKQDEYREEDQFTEEKRMPGNINTDED